MKLLKIKILFALLWLLSMNLFAKSKPVSESSLTPKGKVLILVIDVSRSIAGQIKEISEVCDNAIVKNRLAPSDYFVLMTFGDTANVKYSGQLLRDEDKKPISNTLKSLVADDRKTDIGTAMHSVLTEIVSLKQQDYDLYEPLVLFITDGEIYVQGTNSPYTSVDAMFEDEIIKDTSLYDGWWFVGIENENRSLVDLPEIAKKAGREENLFLLRDIDRLEQLLNDWISKIPPSRSIEKGTIRFSDMKLNKKKVAKRKNLSVANDKCEFSWTMTSTYVRTPVNFEIVSASFMFQSEDNVRIVTKKLNTEAGVISFLPLARIFTNATFFSDKEELLGNGTVKLSVHAKVNSVDKDYEESFCVNFMTPKSLAFKTFLMPAIIILIVILLIVIFFMLKSFLPVKVTMEIVGKTTHFKTVSAGIGKKIDFGSKAGCFFKLDGFPPVVGTLERTGKDGWKIFIRDSSAFQNSGNLNPYKMGSQIKLDARDGSVVIIKFKIKK